MKITTVSLNDFNWNIEMAIEKISGIVTDVVKHNDRHNVVTLYTRSRGRVAFLSPAGTGKSARMRNAVLMPMSVVRADVNFHESKSLQLLGAVCLERVWKDIYFNPVKSAVVMFLTEFIHRYLNQSAPEPLLWDYIVESVEELDSRRGKSASNFHISFMVGFLNFAGIFPDITDMEPGDWFDMNAGVAVAERPGNHIFLTPHETANLRTLLRMNMRNDHLYRFSGTERREILRKMLEYYAVHFPGMSNLKSPEILVEIFT